MEGNISLPAGFNESASGSGLLVPDALSRDHSTVTKAELKHLKRTARILEALQIKMMLFCNDARCHSDERIAILENDLGQLTFRCQHKDRVCNGA